MEEEDSYLAEHCQQLCHLDLVSQMSGRLVGKCNLPASVTPSLVLSKRDF